MKPIPPDPLLVEYSQNKDDDRLRSQIVEKYYPLVQRVAGKMWRGLPNHIDRDDITQCGVFGLMRAAKNFDPTMGVAFESFAATSIRGMILDELRSLDWAPRSLRKRQRGVDQAREKLEIQLGREPTHAEISTEMGLSQAEIRSIQYETDAAKTRSLDEPASEEDPDLYGCLTDSHTAEPEANSAVSETYSALGDLLESLGPQTQMVAALYYYEGLTLSDVGHILGIPESRASQIHTKAMVAVRERLLNELSA